MIFKDKTYEISPFRIIKYVLKHMAIVFWGVSIIPFYMAWVFASKKLYELPSWELEFFKFLIGLIIIGPLLGGGTLLYNDFWDYKMDRISRRKSEYPLPKGLIKRSTIYKISIIFLMLAIILSFIISILFSIIITIIILLSIIYSAPPIRIKSRSGFDVILNSTGAGILCSIAGWIIVRPLDDFPVLWLIPMCFGVAAIYIPTTIIDYDSDRKNKVNTISVWLGQRMAFYLGFGCIIIANMGIMLLGLFNYLITPEFVYVVWPIAVAQIIIYWIILRKQSFENVFRTIIGLSLLLVIGNILLLLYYTGFWVI
jgi:chlorophyll synthase